MSWNFLCLVGSEILCCDFHVNYGFAILMICGIYKDRHVFSCWAHCPTYSLSSGMRTGQYKNVSSRLQLLLRQFTIPEEEKVQSCSRAGCDDTAEQIDFRLVNPPFSYVKHIVKPQWCLEFAPPLPPFIHISQPRKTYETPWFFVSGIFNHINHIIPWWCDEIRQMWTVFWGWAP